MATTSQARRRALPVASQVRRAPGIEASSKPRETGVGDGVGAELFAGDGVGEGAELFEGIGVGDGVGDGVGEAAGVLSSTLVVTLTPMMLAISDVNLSAVGGATCATPIVGLNSVTTFTAFLGAATTLMLMVWPMLVSDSCNAVTFAAEVAIASTIETSAV